MISVVLIVSGIDIALKNPRKQHDGHVPLAQVVQWL